MAWCLSAVVLLGGLVAVGLLLRRRRRAAQPQTRAEVLQAARTAAGQIGKEQCRTGRGTIRGKGGGDTGSSPGSRSAGDSSGGY